MDDPSIQMLILDELNITLRYDHLDLDKVVARLAARRPDLHIVVTGRNAKPALIEVADLGDGDDAGETSLCSRRESANGIEH